MASRYALKLAYDGSGFFGSQAQASGLPTVAGELRKVLVKSGFMDGGERLEFASRTDRGVSAIGNVAVYAGKKPILGKINHHLPESVCVWAAAAAPEGFNPRHAASKTYVYFLPDTGRLDEGKLRRALAYFVGRKDFANFSRREEGRTTVASLTEADVSRVPGFFVLKFKGERFLWQQVRRMVAAAEAVAAGRMNLALLDRLLAVPSLREGVAAAPPEGLVLVEVDYGGKMEFEEKPKTLKERFLQKALLSGQRAASLSALAGSERGS